MTVTWTDGNCWTAFIPIILEFCQVRLTARMVRGMRKLPYVGTTSSTSRRDAVFASTSSRLTIIFMVALTSRKRSSPGFQWSRIYGDMTSNDLIVPAVILQHGIFSILIGTRYSEIERIRPMFRENCRSIIACTRGRIKTRSEVYEVLLL